MRYGPVFGLLQQISRGAVNCLLGDSGGLLVALLLVLQALKDLLSDLITLSLRNRFVVYQVIVEASCLVNGSKR